MKTALVVSGGGDKGAFAVGVIQELRNRGISFDLAAGTSTGALIAPMVSLGDYKELERLYTTVHKRDVIRLNWTRLFLTGIYHTRPIEKLIQHVISEGNPSRYDRLMESKIAVFLCTVSLQDRKVRYYSQSDSCPGSRSWEDREGFVRAVLGSLSQPFIMTLPRLKGDQLADGGVRDIAPIGIAIRSGAERIYVIVNMPDKSKTEKHRVYGNIASIGFRTLSLMSDETLLNDVKMAKMYNEALKYVREVPEGSRFYGKKHVELVVIRPESSLPSSGLDFKPDIMKKMMDLGRQAARKAFKV